jgi:hypothetical protein
MAKIAAMHLINTLKFNASFGSDVKGIEFKFFFHFIKRKRICKKHKWWSKMLRLWFTSKWLNKGRHNLFWFKEIVATITQFQILFVPMAENLSLPRGGYIWFGRKPIWKIYFAPEYRLLKDREFLILSPIDFTGSKW